MKRLLRALFLTGLIIAGIHAGRLAGAQKSGLLTKEQAAAISLNTTCTSLYRKSGQALCSDIPLAKKGLSYIHDIIPMDTILRRNLRAEIERFVGMRVSRDGGSAEELSGKSSLQPQPGPRVDIIDGHITPSTAKPQKDQDLQTCAHLEIALRNTKQQLAQQQQLAQMYANSSNALKAALYSFLSAEKTLFKAHDAYITLLNHSLAYDKQQSDAIVNNLKQAWAALKEAIDELDVAFVAAGMADARFNIDEHYPDIKASLFILEQ